MNRFIQTFYHDKQPPYCQDYMNYPLLPFRIALEPLLLTIDQLRERITVAEICCRHSFDGTLTKDESAALYIYTEQQKEFSLHFELNRALLSADKSAIEPWYGFLKLFRSALEKLPTVYTTIWCGMRTDVAKNLQENEEIVWSNVSSCALSLDTLTRYLDENSVICSIEAISGKNIRGYGYYITEDEVLLLPGTRLFVKGKDTERSTSKRIVHLKEIRKDDYKTSLSPQRPISLTNQPSKDKSRSTHSTASNVSTASNGVHNPSPDKNESRTTTMSSTTTFTNGDVYTTTYINGKKHGYGVYYCRNGEVYQDYLADSKANGSGLCTWSNGDRYEGTFRNGMMDGHGSYFRADEYIYEGSFIGGNSFGTGKSIWPNGNHYEGYHEDGKIHSPGIFHSDKGDKYEGDLVEGKAHGRGKRIWQNGDYYDGHFQNNKKHGFGNYTYVSGSKYSGNWDNDEMSGEGKFLWPSGTRYEGTFKNGKRHGKGKLTFANGQVKNGRWENDNYIG